MKINIFIVLFFATLFIFSQETTGNLEGKIVDIDQQSIPFASVILTDLETNFKYSTSSQESGHYVIANIPPGNNYQLSVNFIGFHSYKKPNITINLGKTTSLNITLKEESSVLDEVVITTATTKKSAKVITTKQLLTTPTINRSVQDLTRNLSDANLNSFGGASNRFNNFNIDGIASNDVVGFQEPASGASGSSANGTPGSLSRSQPISFGAIKELSIKTSPFDVSVGNFTGANINIVTKNGTNTTKGEVYAYGNNQLLIGSYAEGIQQNVNDFYDVQLGGGIGGAIKKDTLFYYVNVEQALSKTPLIGAPGSSGSNIDKQTVIDIADKLRNDYNYDPGTFENADIKTASTKIFARLDYNISEKHKLTLRNNFVKSFADNLEWNQAVFNFGNQGYRHNSILNSTTLEVNSSLTENLSNNLTLGYTKVKEDRSYDGRVFPHIEINDSSNRIFAGTYREASIYKTNLNTFQLSDKLTYYKNNHTITGGLLFQYNDIDYGFLTAWNGRWAYNSVNDFLNDTPSRIRGVYHINNNTFDFVNNTPSATIDILTSAFYISDKIRVSDQFSVNIGVRLDNQLLLDNLPVSPLIKNTPEFSNFTNQISTAPHINPRISFKYNLDKNNKYTLSGGSGLFTGRIPYLWFAYAEYISGTDYFNVDIRPGGNTVPLEENLGNLASQQPGITEINLIDNDFEMPREWKTRLSFEAKLPKNFRFTTEATYTKVLKGIFFQSINRRQEFSNYSGTDNRLFYNGSRVSDNFTNVFLLSNTNKGYRYNINLGLYKSTQNYDGFIGYTNGKSKEVSSTVRNSSAANFEWNQAVNSHDPDLSFSNFDLRHKLVSSHSYKLNLNNKLLQLSMLYTGTSGSPYSVVYQGDVNRDGSSRNDLVYIPANRNEIQLQDITDATGNIITSADEQWNQLNNFIENNDYLKENRGKYAERNGGRTPWNHQLDARLTFDIPFKNKNNLQLSLDVFNVLNLLNKNWGRLIFVPNVVNSNFNLLEFKGVENNQPVYQFTLNEEAKPWVLDAINSRWKAQLGIKYQF
ncbi:TonB-dependent receptor [Tenacibaculum sp. M341]|uniref:TonB-dependent receptor n=1 Tax=Tenacibaculum sp. M341 TaxID=2530339 RepID=UPI0010513762|nr:TonB-dependent receptor [Tenacibaculum sp. M341]TCI84928.1 TonB-dependent receptor [Tenacibaculum sp. M341]